MSSSDSQKQYSDQAVIPVWYGLLGQQLRRLAKPLLLQQQRGLFSITLEVPVASPSSPPQTRSPWVYWHRPAEKHKLVAMGEAVIFTAAGEDRFIRLEQEYEALQSQWTHVTQGGVKSRPRAFVGYAFDAKQVHHPMWKSYPVSQLYIPSVLIEWSGDCCTFTFTCLSGNVRDVDLTINSWLALVKSVAISDAIDTSQDQSLTCEEDVVTELTWLDRVARAKQTIGMGKLDKVVLSRYITAQGDNPISLANLFSVLQYKYPTCTLLAMNFGGASLVAATPERLFEVRMGEVTVDALAGTVAADDVMPRLDMQQYEHEPVVAAIERALAPLCEGLEFARQPRRMKLGKLQHLWTPVKGRLKNKVSLFQLIQNLHPTPAVGGVPTAQACDWISQQENWRGWYTGGFGWLGDNREGDLVVLLRCALIDGAKAELFAGAGITSVSNPSDELKETRLKFAAMLDALHGAM